MMVTERKGQQMHVNLGLADWGKPTDVLISQLVCQTNPLRLMLHGRTIYDGMLELLND